MKTQTTKFCHSKQFVSLTTDYGWTSEGIGIIKGTILSYEMNIQIIDLCHTIYPYSIINGVRQMETIRFLPIGIHLGVVDPGVGTSRIPIAVQTQRGDILLGPDNGLLMSTANLLGGIEEVYKIDFKENNSTVFDGRDVFAHVAGILVSNKATLADIGQIISSNQLIPSPLVDYCCLENTDQAIIVHINRFGNLVLNIKSNSLIKYKNEVVNIEIKSKKISAKILPGFELVPDGRFVICDDGYGRICIAANKNSAKEYFQAEIEDDVIIKLLNNTV